MSALRKTISQSVESQIQQWLDGHVAAIKGKDIARVMRNYAPDALVYDCMPPLKQDISDLRKNYELFFSTATDPHL